MDPDDELRMHPGPKKPSLLHLQPSHRSSTVWDVSGGDAHRSRRRNPTQSRFPALHERMIPILQDLQFDGVARLSSINVDWSLITALVERWRPETHTFHLPVGECTVTLQDVNILLGLRIDGDVVTGSTGGVDGGWKHLIEKIFGKAPPDNNKDKTKPQALKGGRLLLSWLTTVCSALPVDPSEEEVRRYTQSYILQLIAGVLFTDHSGGQVHCMFIPLIQDLGRCRDLAWGAAVLAYLFRELCKSCRTGVEEIAGCLLLLQLWAWTRLPFLAPVPRGPMVDNPIWGDRVGPYAMRWCCPLKFTDTSSHLLSAIRLSLDALGPTQFIWQPYSEEILSKIPDHWKEGAGIWCYKGPLICFHIVEPHLPDRCMRQFGMIQDVPPDVNYSKALHEINLQGKQSTNWRSMHQEHILHWSHRREHLIGVGVNVGIGVNDVYDTWYTDITRRFHTRIGGSYFYSLDLLDHIAAIAKGEIDGTNEDIAFYCAHGKQVIQGAFSHGVIEDFPVEERREKEIEKRPKPKRIGHKGGRGGINAPPKDGLQDEVHREAADLGHEGGAYIDEQGEILRECVNLEQPDLVTPTPSFGLPNWNLLPPGDFLRMSNDDVVYHSPEHSALNKEPDKDQSPPLSHPTFNLLSQSPPQPELVPDPTVQHQPSSAQHQVSPLTHQNQPPPSAQHLYTTQRLSSSVNRLQLPRSAQPQQQLSLAQQQPPPRIMQQPLPTAQQQQQPSPVKEEVLTQQQHFEQPVQQEVPHPHNLRERKSRHTNCGTDGKKIPKLKHDSKKIPNLKRLRKKY